MQLPFTRDTKLRFKAAHARCPNYFKWSNITASSTTCLGLGEMYTFSAASAMAHSLGPAGKDCQWTFAESPWSEKLIGDKKHSDHWVHGFLSVQNPPVLSPQKPVRGRLLRYGKSELRTRHLAVQRTIGSTSATPQWPSWGEANAPESPRAADVAESLERLVLVASYTWANHRPQQELAIPLTVEK